MNYEFEVLTIRDLNFKDQTGKEVNGQQLWVIGETEQKSWNGYEVVKLWIPSGSRMESLVHSLRRGDKIEVFFNRYGKPEDIRVI